MTTSRPPIRIRDYDPSDAEVVNETACRAWEEFRTTFPDFDTFIVHASKISELAQTCELIVAEADAKIVGVVGYGPPGQPKQEVFDQAWAVVRMLSVHPDARGLGVGRHLTDECVRRARRDGASTLALYTTKLNDVALKMYLKMGFRYHSEAPPVGAFPAELYRMDLHQP